MVIQEKKCEKGKKTGNSRSVYHVIVSWHLAVSMIEARQNSASLPSTLSHGLQTSTESNNQRSERIKPKYREES
jgi:hypothetical protein